MGGSPGFWELGMSVCTGPEEGWTDVFGSVATVLGVGVVVDRCDGVNAGAAGWTTTEVAGVICVSRGAGAPVVKPHIAAGTATTAAATSVTRPVSAKSRPETCLTAWPAAAAVTAVPDGRCGAVFSV